MLTPLKRGNDGEAKGKCREIVRGEKLFLNSQIFWWPEFTKNAGFIQTLDFSGDGTRIPMIAASAWTRPGHIAHNYSDHAPSELPTGSHPAPGNFPVRDRIIAGMPLDVVIVEGAQC